MGRLSRCARVGWSCRPSTRAAVNRATHLRTVRGQTPMVYAAPSGACPFITDLTIRSRPNGAKRAFLSRFI